MEGSEKQESNNKSTGKHLWAPGESGNAAGRPKKGNAWADVISEYLDVERIECTIQTKDKDTDETIERTIIVDGKGKTLRRALALRLISDAFQGDKKAFEILMDREVGKPPQGVDLTNNGKSFDSINVTIKEISSQET